MERQENMRDLQEILKFIGGIPRILGMNNTPHSEVDIVHDIRKMLYEWKAYKDLWEQGKLLKLPCAVGDTVYVLRIDNAAYMMSNKRVWEIVEERFEVRHFDCIGKTVFITREKAEAALKEFERGKEE